MELITFRNAVIALLDTQPVQVKASLLMNNEFQKRLDYLDPELPCFIEDESLFDGENVVISDQARRDVFNEAILMITRPVITTVVAYATSRAVAEMDGLDFQTVASFATTEEAEAYIKDMQVDDDYRYEVEGMTL